MNKTGMKIQSGTVDVEVSAREAYIQNHLLAVCFDLQTGTYSGFDRASGATVFADAWFRLGEGGWKEPPLTCEAVHAESADDAFGKGDEQFHKLLIESVPGEY